MTKQNRNKSHPNNGTGDGLKVSGTSKSVEAFMRSVDERLKRVEDFMEAVGDVLEIEEPPSPRQSKKHQSQQHQQQQKSNSSKGSKNKGGKQKNGSANKSKRSSRSCAACLLSTLGQLVALLSLVGALVIIGFVGHRYYTVGRPPTVDEFVKSSSDFATFAATNAKQGYAVAQKHAKKYYAQFERDHLPVIRKYTNQAIEWTKVKSGEAWVLTKKYYAIGSEKVVEYYGLARAQVLTWYSQIQGGSQEKAKPAPPKAEKPKAQQQNQQQKQQQQQQRGRA